MIVNRFPGIKRAALAIAYDNGMINRNVSEAAFCESLDATLGAEGYYEEDLAHFDRFLDALDDKDLDDLCTGEEREQAEIAARCPDRGPEVTLQGLLLDIFGG